MTRERRNILVTGATGFVGRHLVDGLLRASDVQVNIITRGRHAPPDEWVGRVKVWTADLADESSLKPALSGLDVVYHLAAETRDPVLFHKVNVAGTRNLLNACAEMGLSRFLHVSSAGVVGSGQGHYLDEETSPSPEDEYEQSKLMAEETVRAFADKEAVPATIIRPTIVFGEGTRRGKDSFGEWLRAIQSGRFWPIGRGSYVANYIYVKDLVAGCILAANSQKAVGETYILSDPCSMKEFINMMAAALGKNAPRLFIPVPLAHLVAAGFEMLQKVSGRSVPLTLLRVRALTSRRVYSARKIQEELGFQPTIGLAEGMRRTVASYIEHGFLLPCDHDDHGGRA